MVKSWLSDFHKSVRVKLKVLTRVLPKVSHSSTDQQVAVMCCSVSAEAGKTTETVNVDVNFECEIF